MNNRTLKFVLDGRIVEIDFVKSKLHPSTTVLNYLRSLPGHKGTKEGCAEGDCGACTVVLGELVENRISYSAVDSCLLFLPAIHGKQLITVENLANHEGNNILLHPVQQAMIDHYASQCGFCTPGIVMSLFALYKSDLPVNRNNIIQALSGNLCRCTGYDPIYQAALQCCLHRIPDHFTRQEPEISELLKYICDESTGLEIKTPNQYYFLPKTLPEAIEFRASNPDARVINGATDTAIQQNKNFEFHKIILDLSAIQELKTIRKEKDGVYLSAGTTIEMLKNFAETELKILLPLLDVFASWQIRNVATIGGNLATASPIGDLIPVFIALKAKVELISQQGNRWVEISDFITGYRKNCIQPDELILGVFLPSVNPGVIFKTEKVSNRRDLDISTLSLAMRLETCHEKVVKEIILAFGGMADQPKRAFQTEQFLTGQVWSGPVIGQAMKLLEQDFTPICDARASALYRLKASKNLLLKMFTETSEN